MTYQDVAKAVILVLEEKADINATSNVGFDTIALIDSRGAIVAGNTQPTGGGNSGGGRGVAKSSTPLNSASLAEPFLASLRLRAFIAAA